MGLLAFTSLVLGCGATSFDGRELRKPRTVYRVGTLGSAWQRVSVEGMDLAYHRQGHGSIGVHATCDEYDDVPQRVLLNHLLFGTTKRLFAVDEEVSLDGRGARHAVVNAELDGVPLRFEIYLLTRSLCVFDLTYVSDARALGRAEFGQFVRAFHIEDVRHD